MRLYGDVYYFSLSSLTHIAALCVVTYFAFHVTLMYNRVCVCICMNGINRFTVLLGSTCSARLSALAVTAT